jgi:hypothetical protein
MARRLTELCREKSLNEVPCRCGAHGLTAKTNDIHVVVLNALLGGKMVVDQGSAYALDFVGADGGSDAAATNGDPSIHFSFRDRLSE